MIALVGDTVGAVAGLGLEFEFGGVDDLPRHVLNQTIGTEVNERDLAVGRRPAQGLHALAGHPR